MQALVWFLGDHAGDRRAGGIHGHAVATGGIPTACAFTGSACAIGGSAVVLYSGNGGADMLVPVFEQGSPWSTAAAGRCVGVGSPSSMKTEEYSFVA